MKARQIVFALACGAQLLLATTIRSYYIGNSVTDTIRYDSLRQMAEGKGDANIWGRQMIPGAPLDYLWNYPDSGFQQPPYGYPTNALPYYPWDCLSLQPFDRTLASDTNSISNFITLSLPRNSNMQVYVYSRWPRQSSFMPDYDTTWQTNLSGFNECRLFFEDVCRATRELWVTNITKPVRIVPCGDALYALNQKMKAGQVPGFTNIVQVYADGIHFNDTGAYVVACTYFATMYKESPIGLNASIYGINDTALARIIETTVWDVVRLHPYAGVLPEILPMAYSVGVPEGGVATLKIKLTDPPAAVTTVSVTRIAGDTDITVSNGATLVFTPANYAGWQTVTLAAAEDGDWQNGSATIAGSGAGVAGCQFVANELDNDASAVCYDGFDCLPRPLHGATTGYGWNGGWVEQNNKTNQPGYDVSATGLTHPNLVTKGRGAVGGNAYETCGRGLAVATAFAPWATNAYIGKDGTELWMSYLVRVANAGYPGSISLSESGIMWSDNGRVRVQGNSGVWRLTAMNDTIVAPTVVPVVANTNYLMVLRLQFGSLADRVDLFINPPLTGAAPALADATVNVTSELMRISNLVWYPDSSAAHGWLDEIRFGGSFANVTPTMAAVYTNNNNITVNGVYENDERSGYALLFTGMISGTGTFVEATGLSNTFVGTISPGFSAGTLTFNQATGVFVFGTSATPLQLHIENGDLLLMTNLAAPLDLGTLEVTFFSPTTYHETNWFLSCASGISGELHATNFVMYTSGQVIYDNANGRVGVWIIPEPACLVLLGAGGAWLRHRRR
ncbi:MAG: hypothetical protein NTV22_19830 [bacterium]|nr:hypothetical protein [bacterium]